jgi:transcription elongation factor GreA
MNKPETTWLSQEAYDRLKDELADLITNKRSEIAKKIQEAREEGDLSENGGYQAAKEEQGRIEARINRLEEMLSTAEVGEAPKSHGVVEQGVVVSCELNGNPTKFLLGSSEILEGTGSELDVYSTGSPIGAAVMGKKIGDEVEYDSPNGKKIKVKITGVENLKT